MKNNIVVAAIIAVALIISSLMIKGGIENASPDYSLYSHEGVLYRLNDQSGRIDALVPSNEASLLFPIGQMQFPKADAKLTDEQKASISQNLRTVAQYIQSERARGLGFSLKNTEVSK